MNKIVLATGGFDPIHSGHLAYLSEAKKLGNQLWVGVNSDEWLIRKKGRPFMPFAERLSIVSSLKQVDVALGFEDDKQGSSNNFIQYVLNITDRNTEIIVANGGDRNAGNIPEVSAFEDVSRVSFAWGVGGNDKANSSSWILDEWKNPKTYRNWGWYRVLDEQPGYKVKELVIEPRKSLSMQRHFKRSEHWYVLKGSCTLNTYRGDYVYESQVLCEHPRVGAVIDREVWHQGQNHTNEPCHILEVQYGDECVESDIERRNQE